MGVQVVPAVSTAAVSEGKNFAPQSQRTPATNIIAVTARNATFMFVWSATIPINGGATASPSAWIIKMFNAKAVARTDGRVTFASAVFEGPVLKKRKKSAINISPQASGNGTKTTAAENG